MCHSCRPAPDIRGESWEGQDKSREDLPTYVGRKGTPETGWRNAERKPKKEKILLLPMLLRGPDTQLCISLSLSLFFHKMGIIVESLS